MKWITGIGCAVVAATIGGIAAVKSFQNSDAVQVIASTVKSENLTADQIDPMIVRLIKTSEIHGRVKAGLPVNVWGRQFAVERTENSVVCRSPGIWGIGTAETTQ